MMEISSKGCRKIPIDRALIDENINITNNQQFGTATNKGFDDGYGGGNTVYDAGKTPNYNYNTPSYYPNSPHWGAHASPGYGGATDCKNICTNYFQMSNMKVKCQDQEVNMMEVIQIRVILKEERTLI